MVFLIFFSLNVTGGSDGVAVFLQHHHITVAVNAPPKRLNFVRFSPMPNIRGLGRLPG